MNEIRIHQRSRRIDAAIIERFRPIAAANVADAMGRTGAAVGIRPVGQSLASLAGQSVVGPAFTVATRPGDNLAVHKALDLAQPGDMVVVDAQGDLWSSILGELMTRYAGTRGVAALIVEGAIRDWDVLSSGILPIFARGVSHIGPTKVGPGVISGPVTLGGRVVRDGDLLVGDSDGITVVPYDDIESVLAAAEQVVADETVTKAAIAAGSWDRSWVDAAAHMIAAGDAESR